MVSVRAATTEPYFANSQNPIGMAKRSGRPVITTFTLAPIAVGFPPRSAPRMLLSGSALLSAVVDNLYAIRSRPDSGGRTRR